MGLIATPLLQLGLKGLKFIMKAPCLSSLSPVNSFSVLMSSCDDNSSNFLSSPLSTISQIFSANLVPTPGRALASWN